MDSNKNYAEIPSKDELKEYLRKRAKFFILTGWIISFSSIVFIIILIFNSNAIYIAYLLGTLFIGQGLRYNGREIKRRINNPLTALPKRKLKSFQQKREKIIKEYFKNNKKIAEKVLQMEEFAAKGNFNDAFNIASSLIKKNPPEPVLNYLNNKKRTYGKMLRK
ncbi:MAG: hypothetical protein ACTSRZ_03370 [Promethearchaeota archaeon]